MKNLTWEEALRYKGKQSWLFSDNPTLKKELPHWYFVIRGFPLLDALIFLLVASPVILLLCAVGITLFLIVAGLLLIVGLLFIFLAIFITIGHLGVWGVA